jgi:hypothetical protein
MPSRDTISAPAYASYTNQSRDNSTVPSSPSSSSTTVSLAPKPSLTRPAFSPGELGKLATRAAWDLKRLGWAAFIASRHHTTSVNTNVYPSLGHPVIPYLYRLATCGVPAPSTSPPWSAAQKSAAYQRGPHISAAKLYSDFLLEDMFQMVQEGYWTVLPFSTVAHLTALKLSPAGVVPQRERRPRLILDYSYPPEHNVNDSSLPLAPTHAMQFGKALPRILQRLVYCNKQFGPPLMAKLDLADGYYRVPLAPSASLQLAVVLPGDGVHDRLIGIPLCLPMGWTYSPPYFCAFTETATDIANASLTNSTLPPHPLEHTSQLATLPAEEQFHTTAFCPLGPPSLPPLAAVDVYLDDFMAIAQRPRHLPTMRSLLHSVDAIFYNTPHSATRRAVISQSKIDKGEATWSTQKTLLGWHIDTAAMTLTLPPHRQTRLLSLLADIPTRQRVSRKKWQQLLGELRSMALAFPSAKFHFSLLQNALVTQKGPRIRLTTLLRQAFRDWNALIVQLAHPTPLLSLVPRAPDVITACDASAHGMGGWIWAPHQRSPLLLWRIPLPVHIQRQLVSASNPTGLLNNSELELAAIVLSATIAAHTTAHPHPMIWCASDNVAAVSWANNGSTSTTNPAAFLLRMLGHLNQTRRFDLLSLHVAGESNMLADELSRCFDLSLCDIVAHSAPQVSWQPVHPPPEVTSSVLSALSRQIWKGDSPQETHLRNPVSGASGNTFALPYAKTLICSPQKTQSPSCNYLPAYTEQGSWLPNNIKFRLKRWERPFVPWGRRWPHWDSQTPGSPRKVPWTLGLPANWQPMPRTTHPRNESNPSRYPSCAGP